MIHDLTQTIRQILDAPNPAEYPDLHAAKVSLERPSDGAAGDDTVHLFLYDVRENSELRNNEHQITRLNGTSKVAPPPMRVACSYLLTVQASGDPVQAVLKEHKILSQALQLLAGMPKIPNDKLVGTLKDQEPPLPLLTAQPNAVANPAEFWSAIGAKLRPSLVVTATISLIAQKPIEAFTVKTSEVRGLGEPFFRIGGAVTNAADEPVANAQVWIVETGVRKRTDDQGRFRLQSLDAGTYTLRVESAVGNEEKSIIVPAPDGETYDVQLP